MIVGVPRESFPGELRVALTPAVVPGLAKRASKLYWRRAQAWAPAIPMRTILEGRQGSRPARRSVPHRGHHRSGAVLWLE